jgi:hypothetical protein
MDDDEETDPDYVPTGTNKQQLRIIHNLRQLSVLTDHFWKLWRDHILLDLRRGHGKRKNVPAREPKPGDVVLVYEEDLPRTHWKPALVQELIKSRNGDVIAAKVRLSSGIQIDRSVQHLYPLGPPLSPPHSVHFSAVLPSGTVANHSSFTELQLATSLRQWRTTERTETACQPATVDPPRRK